MNKKNLTLTGKISPYSMNLYLNRFSGLDHLFTYFCTNKFLGLELL